MPNRRFATALASALADLGVRHAVISPGSRNTPLIAGFAAEGRIEKWPVIDERSAGFFALGLAKASHTPVVLACTSGTAAVEYHPAVVEASQSDVPLLILTADRPAELRDVGAPQTVDQISLYGSAVRMFAEALPPDTDTAPEAPGEIAIDIWAHATASPPGPVHLNLPFREPLLEPATTSPPAVTAPAASPYELPDLDDLVDRLNGKRGVIVAGRCNDPDFPAACAALARAGGFPVLADPLSGLRHGSHVSAHILSHGDLLATAGALDAHRPEVVIRFGPVPTSKPVWSWLAGNPDVDQILIDEQSRDATSSARTTLELEPAAAAGSLAATVGAPTGWLDTWVADDEAAAARVAAALRDTEFPNEPAVARTIIDSLPEESVLTVGSSMPIRDVDSFGGTSRRRLTVHGNRGANGIDGTVSAALGTAASGSNALVLLGDVAMFHDLNALGTAKQLGLPMTIVVVHNDGGGIFHFLPQHDPNLLNSTVFETYLATPHGTDFVDIGNALGLETHRVDDAASLSALVATTATGPRLIQVHTDREQNLELHRRVTAALDGLFR
ncbi:MAG: 2-succinyl-5-enolpyruvyl-6-hydroxy-3-cyclohexene-1-carboxylic-acid synthase [Acidimicrobiia bacterium]|nr:2-succinyl-5-enolpyruvyl-6-hydroxy-3-cyclohexene-1-carboxylic-acid synthase [Acidimicrobiia bacterium]